MGERQPKKAIGQFPAVTDSVTLASGRFLELRTLTWIDRHGNIRQWESADRRGDQRAVLMIATLRPSGRIVLIRQFRPPVDAHVIEFPAGLIDGDESPETAALRELREETGYIGQVESVSPFACSSPGLTGEAVALVEITIDETLPENVSPIAQPDTGEDIERFTVPLAGLQAFLDEQVKAGSRIDNKVVAYALASR